METISDSQLIGMLLLQGVLILVSAFFSAAESAVAQLPTNKLQDQIEEGNAKAQRLINVSENMSDFLANVQTGSLIMGFVGTALAIYAFTTPLAQWLYMHIGFVVFPYDTLYILVLILIAVILACVMLLFGVLVPRQVARKNPYKAAKYTVDFVLVVSVLIKPAMKLLRFISKGVLYLFGIRGEQEESVTEDEIRMMVDEGMKSGNIDSEESEMIKAVFELDKTIARDVMTHRVDVVIIEEDTPEDEIVNLIGETGYSRFPVCGDSSDDILGVLSSRTFLLNLRKENPCAVRELLRLPRFVPETVRADILLRDMQKCNDHMAIVLDEYGGFSGVVTMEDLIEEIVGDIFDEFDDPEDEGIHEVAENLWRISGDTDIEEMESALQIKMPQEREYDTLGGLVFSCMSTIPDDGEEVEVEVEGLKIITEPIEDHHVVWAKVSILPPDDDEETEPEENKKQSKKSQNIKEAS